MRLVGGWFLELGEIHWRIRDEKNNAPGEDNLGRYIYFSAGIILFLQC